VLISASRSLTRASAAAGASARKGREVRPKAAEIAADCHSAATLSNPSSISLAVDARRGAGGARRVVGDRPVITDVVITDVVITDVVITDVGITSPT
jgi:hypothetical protein